MWRLMAGRNFAIHPQQQPACSQTLSGGYAVAGQWYSLKHQASSMCQLPARRPMPYSALHFRLSKHPNTILPMLGLDHWRLDCIFCYPPTAVGGCCRLGCTQPSAHEHQQHQVCATWTEWPWMSNTTHLQMADMMPHIMQGLRALPCLL